MRNIPFSRPYFDEKDINDILANIEKSLRSGWITSWQIVKDLENNFAKTIDVNNCVVVNSGTAALHTILLALEIGRGDEVIVPTNTFVATANAVRYVGGYPMLADSDPDTFNISPKSAESLITDKTKAIIVVHLGGNPVEIDQFRNIAEKNNLVLIEDAAHAHGSRYKDTYCGNFGIANAFSFYSTKVITSAEGGCVVTNNAVIADKIKVFRNQGRMDYGPLAVQDLGYNYRMPDILASIGISQLAHLTDFVKKRNSIANYYEKALPKLNLLESQKITPGGISSYYAYLVKIKEDIQTPREKLRLDLKNKGIGTSIMYHPIHLQPYYKEQSVFRKGDLPIAENLGEKSFALPMHNGMTIDDAEYIIQVLEEVIKQ